MLRSMHTPTPPGPAPPAPPAAGRRGTWALLALLFLWISAALVYPPMTKVDLYESGFGGRLGDVGMYVSLYQGTPLHEVARPFRYRLFTPMLARLVPLAPPGLMRYFDLDADKLVKFRFGVVNLFGLTATGLLLVLLGEALGLRAREGLIAALLYYTSFPVVSYGGAPMAEAWGHAFLALALVAALRGWWIVLALAALVGMFAKETTALALPAVLVLALPWRRRLRLAAALLPGLVAYAWVRWVVLPGGYGFPSDAATSLSNLAERLGSGPYLLWILFDGGTAFGLLWVFALLGARDLGATPAAPLARWRWLVPAVLAVPFLIGSNIGRIWFVAFPFVIPMAVLGLRRLRLPG
jgi:hypothetical protein